MMRLARLPSSSLLPTRQQQQQQQLLSARRAPVHSMSTPLNPFQPRRAPTVMIVGGGLSGLMLGILLGRANIPFHIFERASQVRPLGSALGLNADILQVFEQLGLMDDIYKITFPCRNMSFYDSKMSLTGQIDMSHQKEVTGYDLRIFARPRLYELLRRQIPDDRVSCGKKVLRMEEKNNKVYIHCSDNSTYEGDILVGADGAYSGVRQSLYRQLDEKGVLPKDDLKTMSVGFTCMVGVAQPKNPEKFPQLKEESNYAQVLGRDRLSWSLFSVPDNQICWGLGVQLSESEAKALQFRNSEWGPESNDAMIKEFENELCPWGGTMGDLIRDTPPELISKVFLEDKLFKTWFHGRTALIGDAAHKMLPGSGRGAAAALQDAVVLANCIYFMPDHSSKSVTEAFQEYHRQRYPQIQEIYKESISMSQFVFGQTWSNRLVRNMVLNMVPEQLQRRAFTKTYDYRPQIAWLPLAENRGTAPVLPQEGKRLRFD
ncbi:MAG: hypothetical protein J3Q66DRAFT_6741 [Benniella sp.]|nr:MAG: hypothetical protein J3Q66DRAFT_6741 [Benniella sp.]